MKTGPLKPKSEIAVPAITLPASVMEPTRDLSSRNVGFSSGSYLSAWRVVGRYSDPLSSVPPGVDSRLITAYSLTPGKTFAAIGGLGIRGHFRWLAGGLRRRRRRRRNWDRLSG